jgi:NADP-dependent 3-hydroxy acid dehydrogenase YdfG
MSNSSSASPPSLSGRVAVITGASSGIGEATARILAGRGAKVALLARRTARIDALAAAIAAAGGTARSYAVDITDAATVDRAAAAIRDQLGVASIVVNNAGVMLPNPIEATRRDEWDRQIALNIGGVMNTIAAFTAPLAEAAAAGGVADLVNVSSVGARNVFSNFAVYCATKAYVTHLSLQLRTELGPKGVRVCALEPGVVGTELADHIAHAPSREWLEAWRSQMTYLTADDIGESIAYAVSAPARVNIQQLTILPTAQV